MEQTQVNFNAIASKITDWILSLNIDNNKALLIALDGGSGSGKSTIAEIIAKHLNALLIVTDDFYAADITNEDWGNRSYKERAADAINWLGLRSNILEPLLHRMPAYWNSFDFNAGACPDGTYSLKTEFTNYEPNDIIILEGAYSARPELSDLIDLKILIDVPVQVRHKRLQEREEKGFLAQWHERWDGAEEYYFREVRPAWAFDMVIENL